MRYIRTTDGRISYLHREPNEKAADYEMLTSTGFVTYCNKDEVVEVADNVEELCDEFVVVSSLCRSLLNENEQQDIKRFAKSNNGYGAIWIKGEHGEPILKSVAKMKGFLPNGEIDWELL